VTAQLPVPTEPTPASGPIASSTASALRAATDALRDELAAAAEGVPGVARLEPTLRNALRRLQAGTTVLANGRGARSAADGIELHRRLDVVDVHVDLVTCAGLPAAATARSVRAAMAAVLRAHDLQPGTLTVAVLSVER
jgi:hypothetical protein